MNRPVPSLMREYIAERGRWLYHCTDVDNLTSILRAGLRPSVPTSQYDHDLLRPGNVYLCDESTARNDLAGSGADWGDAAVAIDLWALDPGRLEADDDYWRGELLAAGITDMSSRNVRLLRPALDQLDNVLASLRDGGTCSYRGVIEPAAIRVAYVAERPDVIDIDLLLKRLFADGLYGRSLTDPSSLRHIDLATSRWLSDQHKRLVG